MDNSDENQNSDMRTEGVHIEDERLYDDLATATFLNLKNHRTLANWRCTKRHPELPYIKIGSLVRYRGKTIKRFLELCTVEE